MFDTFSVKTLTENDLLKIKLLQSFPEKLKVALQKKRRGRREKYQDKKLPPSHLHSKPVQVSLSEHALYQSHLEAIPYNVVSTVILLWKFHVTQSITVLQVNVRTSFLNWAT